MVDIEAGTQDLQQCADAIIRLQAKRMFSHDPNQVHFHLTTGYDFWFSDYVAGKTFKGHSATHEKFILLAQSYMPAQGIHVSQPNWGVSP